MKGLWLQMVLWFLRKVCLNVLMLSNFRDSCWRSWLIRIFIIGNAAHPTLPDLDELYSLAKIANDGDNLLFEEPY